MSSKMNIGNIINFKNAEQEKEAFKKLLDLKSTQINILGDRRYIITKDQCVYLKSNNIEYIIEKENVGYKVPFPQ